MDKKIKLILATATILSVPLLIIMGMFRLEKYFFLWLLGLVILLILFFKLTSQKIMGIGFALFFISVFFTLIIKLNEAEFFMRISFMFWIAGLFLAMSEYLADRKNKN